MPPGTEEQLPEILLEVYEKLNPRCEISHNSVPVGYATPNGVTRWRVDSLLSKEPATIDWIESFQGRDVLVDVGTNVGLYPISGHISHNLVPKREGCVYALLGRKRKTTRR